jgi:hypothetical protein
MNTQAVVTAFAARRGDDTLVSSREARVARALSSALAGHGQPAHWSGQIKVNIMSYLLSPTGIAAPNSSLVELPREHPDSRLPLRRSSR